MYKQCPDRAYVSEQDIALCFLLALLACFCLLRPTFSSPTPTRTRCSPSIQASHTRLFSPHRSCFLPLPPLPSFFFFLTFVSPLLRTLQGTKDVSIKSKEKGQKKERKEMAFDKR
ncbi:hypothetical protein F5X96DRAFT_627365 [Biscogniauxia mediterranea]|nr:hypothetical protein F5X96DRAFT_627365 [Biscogniauxia mediterranea]